MDSLVSTGWLAEQLADEAGAADLQVLDASSHLPDAGRDARAEFSAAHIPGARFLDLASLTDAASRVPAALPGPEQFAARMAGLGVAATDRIVIYDDSAVRTSARAWFIARLHGARRVAILDGGLGKWRAERRPLESGVPAAPGKVRAHFTAAPGAGRVRDKVEMLANLATPGFGVPNLTAQGEQMIDARSAARFSGEDPEPRPDIASGHIPGSLNLPFDRVLNEDGTFKDDAGLRAAFAEAGVDLHRPVVTTCGSGVTAAVLLFALHRLGKDDLALYDGSWSEWGADPHTPKATGPAFGRHA